MTTMTAKKLQNIATGPEATGVLDIDRIPVLATGIRPWAPTTAYSLGQQVVSPNNDIVSAIAAHTSGATFTAASWDASSTYGRKNSIDFATAGGPPTRGSHVAGEFAYDQQGGQWLCTVAGSPGKWVAPGFEQAPKPLDILPVSTVNMRVFPGTFLANGALTNERAQAAAWPVPDGVMVKSVTYKITTAGNAGAVMRVSVYSDAHGFPADLLGEGTGAADAIAQVEVTFPTPIAGNRWLWVVFTAQGAPTTAPQVARQGYSPFYPVQISATGDPTANGFVAYVNGVSGAMSPVWPAAPGGPQLASSIPWHMVRFTPTSLASRKTLPDRVVVLTGDEPWEEGCLQECNVYNDGAQWVMIYSGGWTVEGLGWATAPTIDGPWTKQGKLLGNGAWIVTGRSSILWESGTLYVYFSNAFNSGLGVVSGPDPAHLSAIGTAMALPAGCVAVMNSHVRHEGATYHLMFESKATADTKWQIGYATGTNPLGPFTLNTFPLSSLQPHIAGASGACYGGPWLTKTGATYSLWYHANIGNAVNLPTDIFRATSTDFINWTPNPVPMIRRMDRREVDQVADPFLVTDPDTGLVYAFWEGFNNVAVPGESSIFRSIPTVMAITP